MRQSTKKVIVSTLILAGVFATGVVTSQKVSLNSILPRAGKNSQPVSDEQQAILAVRKAKASVVNIFGVSSKINASSTDSLTLNANPNVVYGTGIIWSSDGEIVTNNHVVTDSSLNYFAIFADGKRYPIKVIGKDKYDDLALLKIDATGLTPAALGNSDQLETGQTVFAIGNSLGRYQFSVTKGVVSGLGRSVDEMQGENLPVFHNWIQTDAAISRGNSGGPLVNMLGEVVGINAVVDTEGASLGFSIPVNWVKDAVMQLKQFGTVSRPYLGIQFNSIDSVVKIIKNLQLDHGALVVKVVSGSPAEKAGVWENDIITSINGEELTEQKPLDLLVQKYGAGSQIILKVHRGSQILDLTVILGQFK